MSAALEPWLRQARDGGRKLLVPYVTGGLDGWVDVVRAYADAGADAIEVGLPFSDPVMDGPVIQEASQRALSAGATPGAVVRALADVDAYVPLVVMTYYNLVFRAGHERFASTLASVGVTGAVVPDLPLEELGPWASAADDAGVATVLLVSPVTPDERLARLCERSRGFVYGTAVLGVTGERDRIPPSAHVVAKRVKAATDKPVLMGVGVSTPSQARELCEEADGVIVGSALVRRMLDGAPPGELAEVVAQLRRAIDGERSP